MLPNKSDKPLALEPVPSRYLFCYGVILHLLALGALLLPMNLPVTIRLGLSAGLLFSLRRLWQHRRGPAEMEKIILKADGIWKLVGQQGMDVGTLREDSYCSRWLVILRFRTRMGRSRQLILLPDSLPADDFRRLRVRLMQIRAGDKPSVDKA